MAKTFTLTLTDAEFDFLFSELDGSWESEYSERESTDSDRQLIESIRQKLTELAT